jgi:fumarylacetoacetase
MANMMQSWLPIDPTSEFSLENLPMGIISTRQNPAPRAATAVGDLAFDLDVLMADSVIQSRFSFLKVATLIDRKAIFAQSTLNAFAALGRPIHRNFRTALQDLLSKKTSCPEALRDNAKLRQAALIPRDEVTMHLPMRIGDYTDFYAGYHHAFASGVILRGADNALQPNYLHLPVAYHGRSSSIVVSGTPIHRPKGQILLDSSVKPPRPVVEPSRRMDMELELGCFIATPNSHGDAIPVDEAEEHIFGYVLLNDWSARDVQRWEYVPLGPFNGKNFASTISPWVVMADALEPFRCRGIENPRLNGDVEELAEYLQESRRESVFDVTLEVDLTSKYTLDTVRR